MGFDVFTLNASRIEEETFFNRMKMYEDELQKDILFSFEPFVSIDYFSDSLEHLYYKLINRKLTYWLELENNKDFSFDAELIKNKISGEVKNGFYENYKIYDTEFIKKVAKSAGENDVFILQPKYVLYYKYFQKYQNIEKQYFEAVKILVKNTKAKVVSFYGINDITKLKSNFDKNGWHFKPKLTKTIYQDLFTNNPKYGTILTIKNIDTYLQKTSKEISLLDNFKDN